MKRGIILAFLLLLSIFSVSAATVTIESAPEHTVWISLRDSSFSNTLISPTHYPIDASGKVFLKYNLEESFTLIATLKKDGRYITQKKYTEAFPSNKDLTIELYPEGYVKPELKEIEISESSNQENITKENSTEENLTETNLENQEFKNFPTGYYSIDELIFNETNYLYAGIILAIIIILIILHKFKKLQKKIKSIEKKIKRSEKKTEKLKKEKEKLVQKMKTRLIKQEEELDKMRGISLPKISKDKVEKKENNNHDDNKQNNHDNKNKHKNKHKVHNPHKKLARKSFFSKNKK